MADINIFGKLNAATGDGIIASANQVEYGKTNVAEYLDNIKSVIDKESTPDDYWEN